LIQRRFILGEEKRIRAEFGAVFDVYAARVRRWL
jgi:protein-S-isoprenylcysteine O-methyltransferase Ste14